MRVKVIHLPVSKLTRQILVGKYGQQPFKFTPETSEYAVMYTMRDVDANLRKIENRCEVVVKVKVANELVRRNQIYAHQIGNNMHNLHISEMMAFLSGRYLAREDIKASLLIFYDLWGITEDDYALETAYRKWTRYKSKFLKSRSPERYRQIAKDGFRPSMQDEQIKIPWSKEKVREFIDMTVFENIDTFSLKNQARLDKSLLAQLQTFCLAEFCNLSYEDIADQTSSIGYTVDIRLRRFRKLLSYNSDLKESIERIARSLTPQL